MFFVSYIISLLQNLSNKSCQHLSGTNFDEFIRPISVHFHHRIAPANCASKLLYKIFADFIRTMVRQSIYILVNRHLGIVEVC